MHVREHEGKKFGSKDEMGEGQEVLVALGDESRLWHYDTRKGRQTHTHTHTQHTHTHTHIYIYSVCMHLSAVVDVKKMYFTMQ